MRVVHFVQSAVAALFSATSCHAEEPVLMVGDKCNKNTECRSRCCGSLMQPDGKCVDKGALQITGTCFTEDGCDCSGSLFCGGGKCVECLDHKDCKSPRLCIGDQCLILLAGENLCSNGIVGVQVADVCCEAECGTCGGSGCSQRPGGTDACCPNRIMDNGLMCSTTLAAPCIVDDMPEAVCDNGVPGVQAGGVCCEAQCEICGGSGCSQRPGGRDACCTNAINANDEMCSVTMEAPCVIE